MNNMILDATLLENACLTPTAKLSTWAAISSLYYLKNLAEKLNIRVEDLSSLHIIEDMKAYDSRELTSE